MLSPRQPRRLLPSSPSLSPRPGPLGWMSCWSWSSSSSSCCACAASRVAWYSSVLQDVALTLPSTHTTCAAAVDTRWHPMLPSHLPLAPRVVDHRASRRSRHACSRRTTSAPSACVPVSQDPCLTVACMESTWGIACSTRLMSCDQRLRPHE